LLREKVALKYKVYSFCCDSLKGVFTVPTTPLLSIDEFLKLPSSECLRELVRGRVIESKLPTALHGYVCSRIHRLLAPLLDESDFVMTLRCGVVTHRQPDSVRGPDLLVYPRQKLLRELKNPGYPEVTPVMACEVIDRDERWLDVMEKGIEYLHAGVGVVCLVDPLHSTVVVLRDHKPPQRYSAKEELSLPELLGDLRVSLADFFA
jgi:Uma2 family endonuclease